MTTNTTTTYCQLPVELTDGEMLDVGREISEALLRRMKLDLKRRRFAKVYGERLKTIDGKISALNATFHRGTEPREVKCESTRDLIAKRVITRRMDTYEVINDRPMYPSEFQIPIAGMEGDQPELFPEGERAQERAAGEVGDLTEEQALADSPDEAEELRADRAAAEEAERAAEEPPPVRLLKAPIADSAGDKARRKRRNRIEDEQGRPLVPLPEDVAPVATTAGCVCDQLPAPERPCIVCVAAMDGGDEAQPADAEGMTH